jgi:hypothetical protein
MRENKTFFTQQKSISFVYQRTTMRPCLCYGLSVLQSHNFGFKSCTIFRLLKHCFVSIVFVKCWWVGQEIKSINEFLQCFGKVRHIPFVFAHLCWGNTSPVPVKLVCNPLYSRLNQFQLLYTINLSKLLLLYCWIKFDHKGNLYCTLKLGVK